ncbi:MAG: hypothetical protein ACRCYR_03695 [Phycicoccus sp.]
MTVFAALVVAALVIGWLAVRSWQSESREELLSLSVNELREQVIAEGATPVVPPATPGDPPPTPDAQLSEAEVEQTVREVIAGYDLPSQQVVQSLIQASVARVEAIPGPAPTQGQVLASVRPVVAAYLAANPPAPGKDGTNGDNGSPGTAGAEGQAGANGKDGAAGRGIASASFDEGSCILTQVYTDGTRVAIGPLCGRDGRDGADAPSPFPFTFTFVEPGSGPLEEDRTFRCTVPAEGEPGQCEQVTSG